MSGRVCEKHNEWCESGVCRWCEPLDPVAPAEALPTIWDARAAPTWAAMFGEAPAAPAVSARAYKLFGPQAHTRHLAVEAEEKRKLKQAADDFERRRSGMVAKTYPAHDCEPWTDDDGETHAPTHCSRCGATPTGLCFAVEYRPDAEGRAARIAAVREQLQANGWPKALKQLLTPPIGYPRPLDE